MAKKVDNKKNKPSFYITTPIYYASGDLHIGHCYTTTCCDAIARFKRMDGFDVYYLTGTDEHGQKVQSAAAERGLTPQAFVDGVADKFKTLWARMDISHDGFIRTTDPDHEKAVADIFTKLYEQGDIYKSEYVGKYCEPCESFWTDGQLVDGKCPDCGRPVKETKEECYFFRLSKYADRVRKLLTETDFLQPDSRVKEMVNNFIDKGLSDLAVTRTSFDWGVKVPFDPKHVIYVWIDALPNYITALGYGQKNDEKFKKYWACDMHVMAKEIIRFHSIVWPAMLMALDLPLPKRVYGHGWIMFDGDKMSKSKGNVVDPFILTDRYGVDALRYYLLRSMPFGDDSNYTNELLLSYINNDIVNDLGNLVRRTLAMNRQYFDGKVKKPQKFDDADRAFAAEIDALLAAVREDMDKPYIAKALEKIFAVIDKANKYIDATKPWALAKAGETERLGAVMYTLLEGIRVCANMLLPFLTKYPRRIFEGGFGMSVPTDFSACRFGAVESYTTAEIEPILNRLDIKKELDELAKIAAEKNGKKEKNVEKHDDKNKKDETPSEITIDEFFRTELRVARIDACEKVEKSRNLLHSTVFDGERQRSIVSGIAAAYKPEDIVGKNVALVANLKPAKLCGVLSEGMLLCSTGDDGLPRLIEPSGKPGDKIC